LRFTDGEGTGRFGYFRALSTSTGRLMSYVTVFEITHETFPNEWWLPFLFFAVIFSLIGTVIVLLTRESGLIL
jgi:hypothetical protein